MSEFFTVSQINRYLKNIIETDVVLQDIWLRGEISNFKAHYSGHLYLTLKDESTTLRAVMFKGDAMGLKIRPEDGMKVLVRCRIGVYEASGSYQAYIREMKGDGQGDLHIAFQQLKAKLEKEGLFDPAYKKTLPLMPKKIGVVTSATGAAVQDICNILSRRYPLGELVIYPSLVQGEDAPNEIISGIEYFNTVCPVDVLIVGRGGGSIEDLWAFNHEGVARAVFASKIPVISAVGHETDFTICDFVADMRAPTPSAAAELAAVDVAELRGNMEYLESSLMKSVKDRISSERLKVQSLGAEKTLGRIKQDIENRRNLCDDKLEKIVSLIRNKLQAGRSSLQVTMAKLDGSSPLKIMSKGYSAVISGDKAVKSAGELKNGNKVQLVFADGRAQAEITEVKENG